MKKPKVRLSGTDGNVFALLGRCTLALRRAGQSEAAKELVQKVTQAGSYHEALTLMCTYVDAS